MSIITTIKHVLNMPGRFIAACNTLAEAADRNTEAVRAMHRDLLSPIKAVEVHTKYVAESELVRELKASIAAVEREVRYLAESERRELQRRGHPHKF